MPTVIKNIVVIECAPSELYYYVTQPSLWHEWHPNSKSAQYSKDALNTGDKFEEVIELQPLSLLPIYIRRSTQYKVLEANTDVLWLVRGKMKGGWIEIKYQFKSATAGTLFTRTLTYEVEGLMSLMLPLLDKQMKAISLMALENLKRIVENQ